MGRYITYSDIVNRHELVGDQGAGEVDSSYIRYAEFEIESSLASKFPIPFSTNNVTVKDLCIDMTFIKLMRTSGDDFNTEKLEDSLKERIEKLLNGKSLMITNSLETIGKSDSSVYVGKSYKPVFGMADVEYSEVSSSRLSFEHGDGS